MSSSIDSACHEPVLTYMLRNKELSQKHEEQNSGYQNQGRGEEIEREDG